MGHARALAYLSWGSKATPLPQLTLEQVVEHVYSGDDETKGTMGPKLDQVDPGTPWELQVRA